MKIQVPAPAELERELAELRLRLAEANEILRAIRNGDVDAVLGRARGDQLFTRDGADRSLPGAHRGDEPGSRHPRGRRIDPLLQPPVWRTAPTPLEEIVSFAFESFVALLDQETFRSMLDPAGDSRCDR